MQEEKNWGFPVRVEVVVREDRAGEDRKDSSANMALLFMIRDHVGYACRARTRRSNFGHLAALVREYTRGPKLPAWYPIPRSRPRSQDMYIFTQVAHEENLLITKGHDAKVKNESQRLLQRTAQTQRIAADLKFSP